MLLSLTLSMTIPVKELCMLIAQKVLLNKVWYIKQLNNNQNKRKYQMKMSNEKGEDRTSFFFNLGVVVM